MSTTPPVPAADATVDAVPVAWIANDPEGGPYLTWSEVAARNYPNPTPLYASPPAPVAVGGEVVEAAIIAAQRALERDQWCAGTTVDHLTMRMLIRAALSLGASAS